MMLRDEDLIQCLNGLKSALNKNNVNKRKKKLNKLKNKDRKISVQVWLNVVHKKTPVLPFNVKERKISQTQRTMKSIMRC